MATIPPWDHLKGMEQLARCPSNIHSLVAKGELVWFGEGGWLRAFASPEYLVTWDDLESSGNDT